MNAEWSELNRRMQSQIKSSATFGEGIDTLLLLRGRLMEQILELRQMLNDREFSAMPCPKAKGYHNKTVAYSLFHIFRIEDIVANSLIRRKEQIFFAGNHAEKMNSPIVTTGNELEGEKIAQFSASLDIDALYEYIKAVAECTEEVLSGLSFQDTKRKMTDADKEYLRSLGTVSEEETASWLIDYWCGKDVRGLIQMPFSRHWIMHIEASIRIAEKLRK